jgi:hypothetical protein
MMPSYGVDETAKPPTVTLPAQQKDQRWRWDDYVAVAVGLLFLIAIIFSFRINDWIMHTFAWGY